MQRLRVMIALFFLVTAALVAGVLAAHWPFWLRAWQWQTAPDGWPAQLPGPTVRLRGGATAMPLRVVPDAQLAMVAQGGTTTLLLLGEGGGEVRAFFSANTDAQTLLDGRGLITGLMAPLYGVLSGNASGTLLDEPLGAHLPAWRDDPRGVITPRQLLWQLSGLAATAFVPLNPASRRAQLASGPDFQRAALNWSLIYPPGSHFEASPVNAQLLAVLAARTGGADFAALLERSLWSRFAAGDAEAMLDHRRGHMAAHCCLRASAADWLRLGLLVANDGRVNRTQILPAGYVAQMTRVSPVHAGYGLGYRVAAVDGSALLVLGSPGRQLIAAPASGRALLWVGAGSPPAGMEQLLSAASSAGEDNPSAE